MTADQREFTFNNHVPLYNDMPHILYCNKQLIESLFKEDE